MFAKNGSRKVRAAVAAFAMFGTTFALAPPAAEAGTSCNPGSHWHWTSTHMSTYTGGAGPIDHYRWDWYGHWGGSGLVGYITCDNS